MDEPIRCVASFSIRAGELRLVDDYCKAHDVSRSQVVRHGLRLALAEHRKAPIPKPKARAWVMDDEIIDFPGGRHAG